MIVVATKMDAAQDPKRIKALQRLAKKRGLPFLQNLERYRRRHSGVETRHGRYKCSRRLRFIT